MYHPHDWGGIFTLNFRSRWIRLLFGREFDFDELLPLWDTLFAVDPAIGLVDFICVAMLLRVRWQCPLTRSSPPSRCPKPDRWSSV